MCFLLVSAVCGPGLAQADRAAPRPIETGVIEPQLLAPPPATPAEQADRDRVGARFNRMGRDPTLDSEDRPPNLPGPITDILGVLSPPFPFANTAVAALGHVTNVQPYLSQDRKAIYTEFLFQIDELLKSKPGFRAKSGDVLKIVREGGSVEFPNGRVVTHEVKGIGEPLRNGHRYVLFLWDYPGIDRFSVTEAWELSGGQVTATQASCSLEERAALTAHSEQEFLALVRNAAR